jgi:hypothetical protein
MAQVVNRNREHGWPDERLDAVVTWALRELGCVGRYRVEFPECRRISAYKGRAWPGRRVVKVWVNRRIVSWHREAGIRLPRPDHRLPELADWLLGQPEVTTSEGMLVWVLGHELFHCEDQFSCKHSYAKRTHPAAFIVMEQRCDEAGFKLYDAYACQGGRERVDELERQAAARLAVAARECPPVSATHTANVALGRGRASSLAAARAAMERLRRGS